MSVVELLERVEALGGTLARDGDRLVVEAPSPLPADLVEELRDHKPALLVALRAPTEPCPRPTNELHIAVDWLTRPDLRPCYACGQTRYWTDLRSGRRICCVCHPPPTPEVVG